MVSSASSKVLLAHDLSMSYILAGAGMVLPVIWVEKLGAEELLLIWVMVIH